jgi:RNA polymerase sigma-70 factor (ECF subfamily)
VKAAVSELVLEYSPFVWRVLIHLGVPRGRLEDACQEVFLAMLKALPRFEGDSSLQTFIYGMCRNVAFTERRRSREHSEIPTEELPETVVQPAQEGELWIKRAHERLIAALARLDEGQRQVFVLYEIEELSMEDIARTFGVPLGTCYSRLYAAREKVHAELRRRALRDEQRENSK